MKRCIDYNKGKAHNSLKLTYNGWEQCYKREAKNKKVWKHLNTYRPALRHAIDVVLHRLEYNCHPWTGILNVDA